SKEQFVLEYRSQSAPTPRWFYLQASPLLHNARGAVLVHVDINERKEAEEALRDREARIRAILDTAADGIITIDEKGIIDSVNHAAELMFGYRASEIVGQNVSTLMAPPYDQEHSEYLRRYLGTGEKRIIGIGREVMGKRRDGTVFPVGLAVSETGHLGSFTGI